MNRVLRTLPPVALAAIVASCTHSGQVAGNNPGSHPTNTGPFDRRGNYIEDWADTPSKWNSKPTSPVLASRTSPAPPSREPEVPVVATHEQPPANANPLSPTSSRPVVNSTRPTPPSSSSSTASASSKPKPTTASAPKPKAAATKKPASTRYVVKRGDTLFGIAQRHKTTVTAIQKANGISGSVIHPGKSLVIPKY